MVNTTSDHKPGNKYLPASLIPFSSVYTEKCQELELLELLYGIKRLTQSNLLGATVNGYNSTIFRKRSNYCQCHVKNLLDNKGTGHPARPRSLFCVFVGLLFAF